MIITVLSTQSKNVSANETCIVNGIGRGINLTNAKSPMDFKEGSPIINEDYLRELTFNQVPYSMTRTFTGSGKSIVDTTKI